MGLRSLPGVHARRGRPGRLRTARRNRPLQMDRRQEIRRKGNDHPAQEATQQRAERGREGGQPGASAGSAGPKERTIAHIKSWRIHPHRLLAPPAHIRTDHHRRTLTPRLQKHPLNNLPGAVLFCAAGARPSWAAPAGVGGEWADAPALSLCPCESSSRRRCARSRRFHKQGSTGQTPPLRPRPGPVCVMRAQRNRIHPTSRRTSPARQNPPALDPREPTSHNATRGDLTESTLQGRGSGGRRPGSRSTSSDSPETKTRRQRPSLSWRSRPTPPGAGTRRRAQSFTR